MVVRILFLLLIGLLAGAGARAADVPPPPKDTAVFPREYTARDTTAAGRAIWSLLRRADRAITRSDYPEATALGQRALLLARRRGSPSAAEVYALRSLALVAGGRSQAGHGLPIAREMLAVAEALHDDRLTVMGYDYVGNLLVEVGQFDEAERWLQKSRAGARRQGSAGAESVALVNLAFNQYYQKKYPQALTYAEEALRVALTQADSTYIINGYNARATMRSALHDGYGAVADAETALRLAVAKGDAEDLLFVRNALPDVYEQAGRLRDALEAERYRADLVDSLDSREVDRRLADLTAQYRLEARTDSIRRLSQETRIAQLEVARAQTRTWLLFGGLVVVMIGGGVFWLQLRRLRRTQAALAAATRTKDRLYSVVAHDLRSPIASFPGLLDLLRTYRHQADSDDFDGLLTEMRDASQQVARLLDNLLQWAAGQHGELTMRPEPLDAAELLREVAALYLPTAQAAGKKLLLHLPDGQLRLLADRQMTRAVLRNLSDNALKYLPAGGVVRIGAEADAATNTVRLFVHDNGPGLTGAQLARFTGQNPAAQAEVRGTGLGLPLCRLLTERQGGRLLLESESGQGLRAVVVLPAA